MRIKKLFKTKYLSGETRVAIRLAMDLRVDDLKALASRAQENLEKSTSEADNAYWKDSKEYWERELATAEKAKEEFNNFM